MEKKYYDLIITLIKTHHKYPGLEAILKDIADDVYEHSKVVIDSVTDEDVIKAYFNKVISTSIVTVPKKMNFNPRARHRIITTQAPEKTIVLQEAIPITSPELEPVIEDDVPEVTLTVEELDDTPITIEETSTEQIDNIEILEFNESANIEDNVTQYVEQEKTIPTQEEIFDVVLEEPEIQTELDTQEEIITNENTTHQIENIDKTLVDKMINGIESSTIEPIALTEEFTEEVYETLDEVNIIEEIGETSEDLLNIETNSCTEITNEEISVLQEIEEEEITEPLDILAETCEENFVEEDSILIENTDSQDVEEALDDKGFELSDDIENNEILLQEDDISQDLEEIETFETVENDLTLDFPEESSVELFDSNLDPEIEKKQKNIVIPTFDCFSFEPENFEYDRNEIMSYLEEIHTKHPERQILTICNLKYNQKLSIKEISEKIEFTEEEVIEVLNEIIDTVKD